MEDRVTGKWKMEIRGKTSVHVIFRNTRQYYQSISYYQKKNFLYFVKKT